MNASGGLFQRIKPCAVGTLTPKNIVYVALAFSSVGIQAENDLEFGGAQRQLRARARALRSRRSGGAKRIVNDLPNLQMNASYVNVTVH